MKKAVLIVLSVLFGAGSVSTFAQQHWQERIFMEYYVEPQGDTVFVDELKPAYVFPRIVRKKNDKDLRKYYRLVYNFSQVYPYTYIAKNEVTRADSILAGENMTRIKKEKYVNSVQDRLLEDFTDIAKNMTISQGQLLCRLVDREVGKTSYDIVKYYKSGIAAGFWQGVAKLFGQNLKTPYDPQGEDRMTEYLIEKWEDGQFDALYFSVFGEWPKEPVIPSKYQ